MKSDKAGHEQLLQPDEAVGASVIAEFPAYFLNDLIAGPGTVTQFEDARRNGVNQGRFSQGRPTEHHEIAWACCERGWKVGDGPNAQEAGYVVLETKNAQSRVPDWH